MHNALESRLEIRGAGRANRLQLKHNNLIPISFGNGLHGETVVDVVINSLDGAFHPTYRTGNQVEPWESILART